MAKAKDKTGEGVAAKPADFGRVADAEKDMPEMLLHPLMAHPSAALAAATAIGLGFATHMTGVFLGSLQGALEATGKLARKIEIETADGGEPPKEPVAEAATPVRRPAQRTARTQAKTKPAPVESAVKSAAKAPAKAKGAAEKPVAAKPAKAAGSRRAKADDLKKISGVGPKLEQVLNGMGVTRFTDIAGWSAEDAARIDAEIGLGGRIERDGWIAQARALAGGRK